MGGGGSGWWIGVGLLTLRITATLVMTPVFYALPQTRVVRTLLMLSLAICIAAGLGVSPVISRMEWGDILVAAMYELALGATLGLGVLIAFAAFAIAGQVLDAQLGFGLAQIVDPVTMRPVPVLTSAFNYLAALVFFALNGHHALLRGISYSLERFPLGAPWSTVHVLGPLLKQAAGLFSLGFALVAPVVFCILLVEFALGVVSRNLPQMNMFVMGIPIKIIVGLAALSFWLVGAEAAMTRIYASILLTWTQIFEAASPGMAGVR
ncbi:flagellar biosynthetic protein FliR [Pseudacidovorax sp. 1753]|uniref:flagellar biosynthetic protein FliR n=1 Tax=Pseudacidovorax sp. 1753 TaxID=3156419 RepID=UPI003392F226